ncbi:helix-turn-helix transcriptional regulator [Christensenellaceae bacterium OttesenSCG-928-K19]|nr:helix-turn-helix transcriptional regulator [Christensenellaceae bacterium OttesenSCG-928-K19]
MNFWENGMDFGDFIEEAGIPIDRLNDYFNGRRDLREDDLARFARVCRLKRDALKEYLEYVYGRSV